MEYSVLMSVYTKEEPAYLDTAIQLITNQVCFFLSILKLSLSALTQAGIVAPTAANVGKSPQYKQSVAGYLPQ